MNGTSTGNENYCQRDPLTEQRRSEQNTAFCSAINRILMDGLDDWRYVDPAAHLNKEAAIPDPTDKDSPPPHHPPAKSIFACARTHSRLASFFCTTVAAKASTLLLMPDAGSNGIPAPRPPSSPGWPSAGHTSATEPSALNLLGFCPRLRGSRF
ncbi:MAG: hypothetical protein KGJ79_12855 [Alphaproteobacteria bacterium]|nr:hypothetical protein [Alphaproteobacteria bacterium]MDE2492264.1 hypothetical protein [Alphaproteobacteria bacterium]